jgi:hypothetical protein
MRTLPRGLAALAAFALAACGGSGGGTTEPPPPPGALALGLVAGQDQTVVAGSQRLADPVVGRLVRQANGRVAFHRLSPLEAGLRRVGDFLVSPLYAQGTVVDGAPVAGAVVCAVSVDPIRTLVPFTPCTNTDANGKATFFFTPGTAAGEAMAEIRGTVGGEPAVFDTAMATVTPGPLAGVSQRSISEMHLPITAGAPFDLHGLVWYGLDAFGNRIEPEQMPAPRWALLPPDTAIRTFIDLYRDTTAVPTDSGWTVTPGAGDGRLYVWFTATGSGVMRVFLDFQ